MNWWVLKRDMHVSWLMAAFCYGVIVGATTCYGYSYTGWLLGVGVLVGGMGFWKRKVYALPLLIIAGVIIGWWRGADTFQQLSSYAPLIGHEVIVKGTVDDTPKSNKRGQLVMQLSAVEVKGVRLHGTIWTATEKGGEIKRGDSVAVEGKLSGGFGTVSASMYQADILKVERPTNDVIGGVRDWFADNVQKSISNPEASLGIGYVVGQRSTLPSELDETLKVVGLTHIVVASGYNLTILVRLTRRLFARISKYQSILAAGCLIAAFIAITGLSPSMSRAGLVATLSLAAWYYGRKFHPLVLLPFAAAVTLLIHPDYGRNDLGWQLSFAAFTGVMVIAPLMQNYFFGKSKPSTVRQIIGETLCAELATLPLLVLAFGQFSNVGLIANLLVLPFVPLAMLLVAVAGVGAFLFPALATTIGQPASWLLHYMVTVAEQLAALPWVQTKLTVGGGIVVLYYMVLAVLCVYVWRKTKFSLRDANIVE